MAQAPATKPAEHGIACSESRRLLDEFGEAVQALVVLHEQQFHAIVSGDPDKHRFDQLIDIANETRQNAKYAYITHVQTHGCG
jgi:hypothetical protein